MGNAEGQTCEGQICGGQCRDGAGSWIQAAASSLSRQHPAQAPPRKTGLQWERFLLPPVPKPGQAGQDPSIKMLFLPPKSHEKLPDDQGTNRSRDQSNRSLQTHREQTEQHGHEAEKAKTSPMRSIPGSTQPWYPPPCRSFSAIFSP